MRRHNNNLGARRGSILLLVLWMVVILGIIGLSYTASVRSQVQSAQSAMGRANAYWAARAGVEKARAALLAVDPAALASGDQVFNDPEAFARQSVGSAEFSLVTPASLEGEEPLFGLVDEGGKININTADRDTLLLLPGITEEMADCLIDWRDDDDVMQPLGAEEDYYETLEDPYPPRNAPLVSVGELRRVRAWDVVFNSAEPDPYARYLPADKRPELMDPEIAKTLLNSITVWSRTTTQAPDGEEKMDLQSVDAEQMRRRIASLTRQQSQSIVDWRGSNQFNSPVDLLDVRQSQQEEQTPNRAQNRDGQADSSRRGGSGGSGGSSEGGGSSRGTDTSSGAAVPAPAEPSSSSTASGPSGRQASASTGPKVFNLQQVGSIIDFFSAGGDQTQDTAQQTSVPGGVNINTASYDVLLAIPGMTEDLAEAIIQQRESAGAFQGAGSIASLAGMDDAMFRSVYPRVATGSDRLRVVSHGFDPATGARVTIEAVLSIEQDDVIVADWREK